MINLLHNPSFESDWSEAKSHECLIFPKTGEPYEKNIDNILTPSNWLTWFYHDPGTWDQPEVRDVWKSGDPRRVRDGDKAMLMFSFFRKHDGGFMQQVNIKPGIRLGFTAYAHAWSNSKDGPHKDDPAWSEGAGYNEVAWLSGTQPPDGTQQQDARSNATFIIGIDPIGGTDPFAESVIWSDGYHIYNEFGRLGVEAKAESNVITVFLRSTFLWSFKHNDAYWDDATLTIIDDPDLDPTSHATKLGAHVLRACSDLGAYIAAKPAVVKLVGEWGLVTQCLPGTLVIGRKHQADYDAQHQYKQGQSPAFAARQFVDDQSPTYQANPGITYWEGHNEPVWNTHEEMTWYADFEVERVKLMAERGLRCVIGNFATGTPDLTLWNTFLSACKAGKEYQAILGLHEYSCPWMWWMTGNYQIHPNDDEGDEGWTTLRYRKVYRQYLIPQGAVIPLVITETGIDPLVNPKPVNCRGGTWKDLGDYWAQHDNEHDKADYYFRQLVWYDRELQKDDYVIGATVFTWGSFGKPWSSYDVAGTDVSKKLIAYTLEHPADDFEYDDTTPPEPSGRGAPRIQYERTFVLIPHTSSKWAEAAAAATWDRRYTIGGSADDAGIGDLDYRRIIAVNPYEFGGDLEEFYETHYPGIQYVPLLAASPADLAVQLCKPLNEDVALCQRDDRWADDDLGECPGGATIGHSGCMVTDLAMILRQVYGTDINPSFLNRLLADAGLPFTSDDILSNWHETAMLFSKFTDDLKTNRSWTALELRDLLADHWHVILRVSGGNHFVLLDEVTSTGIIVINPWTGHREPWLLSDVSGVRAMQCAHQQQPPPPQNDFTLRGINDPDRQGAEGWLAGVGGGWLYVPVMINLGPQTESEGNDLVHKLDFSALTNCRVVVNLRYSWSTDCGGEGTLPNTEHGLEFMKACIWCIQNATNVWGWSIGNEYNNPREFPHGENLTPEYVTRIYNSVKAGSLPDTRLSPGAIDPFYGPESDCREWMRQIWADAIDADFIDLHGYIRGPDPALCWSETRFEHNPLKWQGLNYLECCRTLLDVIPNRYAGLPIVIGECNHLWKTVEPDWGWVNDDRAVDVIDSIYSRALEFNRFDIHQIIAVCLYRWQGDAWDIKGNDHVLSALAKVV